MSDKYTVKSDYTILRRKARASSKGDIFENNLMTITPMEVLLPEGQSLVYSDSNFKFSIRTDTNLKRRHSKSNWLRNNKDEEVWTLNDLVDAPISDESKIRIKPDYSSLRDFAYYGSAVDMVHATVNHVLTHFPGELYFSTDKFEPTDRNGNRINIGDYNIVYNECEINVDADLIDESAVENINRYLCASIENYDLLNSDGSIESSTLTRSLFSANPDFCDEGILGTVNIGGVEITVYVMAGRKFCLYKNSDYAGKSIRPKQEFITEYFETIDEFEYVLLNRNSRPIYKAVFETIAEKEKGYYYTMEPYVWPSVNNWTPDMHSSAYQSYIMRLIKLAQYHDEFDSNNMWRMMTHEAIKNLDWTFFRENGDEIEDLSNIDSSRIEAFIQLYGRQFDGLKRYIDNIKYINKITYDQKNNVPDYLLTDKVEIGGFDALLPIPTGLTTETTSKPLFSGFSNPSSETDANVYFMRNLKLNAPYLNSVKGTREGVIAMLGLLGFCENDYTINEFVTIAKGNNNYCKMDSEKIFGIPESGAQRNDSCLYPSAIDVEMINQSKDSFPVNEMADSYYGIGCKPVIVYKEDGTVDYRYVVPWYENGKQYDGGWYFQSNGGWGKQNNLDVSETKIMGLSLGISALTEDFIYEETENRMKYAESLEEMLDLYPSSLHNDDIYYVTDISNLKSLQNGVYSGITEEVLSHYFIIKDSSNYCFLSGNGWNYIPMSDITSSDPSYDAKRVIYFETIKDDTVGNNPHVAKKDYDSGSDYVQNLDYIFKSNIENNDFSYFSDLDVQSAITTYKFGISSAYTVDNKKVEYFRGEKRSNLSGRIDVDDFCSGNEGEVVNPEGGDKHLEPTANSIVNLKNIEITFKKPTFTDKETFYNKWVHYLKTVVFKYVKQMLPSTAILRWRIEGESEPVSCNLTVTPLTATVEYNGTVTLNGTCGDCSISWRSSNDNVVTVDNNGVVKGVAETGGTAIITATCNGKSVSVEVTAKPKPEAQVTGITVNIETVPEIPARGGSVSCGDATYVVKTHYDDGTTGTTNDYTIIDCSGVTADSKGTVVDVPPEATSVDSLRVKVEYEGKTATASKIVKQQANVVVNTWEVSGKTNESTSGWTVQGVTNYVIDVNPSSETVLSGGGVVDISVLASAVTQNIVYSADTYQKTITPWSAYTSTASGNSETVTLPDIFYENERQYSESTVAKATASYSGRTGGLIVPGFNVGEFSNGAQRVECEMNSSQHEKTLTLGYYVSEDTSVTGSCVVTQEAGMAQTRTVQIVAQESTIPFTFNGTLTGVTGGFTITGPHGSSGNIVYNGDYNNTSWTKTSSDMIEIETTNMNSFDVELGLCLNGAPAPVNVRGEGMFSGLNFLYTASECQGENNFKVTVPAHRAGDSVDVCVNGDKLIITLAN